MVMVLIKFQKLDWKVLIHDLLTFYVTLTTESLENCTEQEIFIVSFMH